MWHASVSIQGPKGPERDVRTSRSVEALAVDVCRGIGGTHEWWLFSPLGIGHLRVPTTVEEAAQIGPWTGPTDDAGNPGTYRRRRT